VGPDRHRGQTDPALLASCFRRSLEVAREVGAPSVAFPAISAGIYGWDAAQVADVAVATVRDFATTQASGGAAGSGDVGSGAVEEVRFVLFNAEVLAEFDRALDAV
jgi:O-acetyl-ADP-ribose deacetylase (regulator of RNase III)